MRELNFRGSRSGRLCPYYRLPQFPIGRNQALRSRTPACAARTERWTILPEYVDRYCTSGYYSRCPRFTAPVGNGFAPPPAPSTNVIRRLLLSAAWVIGIPTAIVFLIMLAAWLTEHVFLATALIDTFGDIQTWLRGHGVRWPATMSNG